jgi:hypothetical protein
VLADQVVMYQLCAPQGPALNTGLQVLRFANHVLLVRLQASRLGITTVVSTDSIRHMLRR